MKSWTFSFRSRAASVSLWQSDVFVLAICDRPRSRDEKRKIEENQRFCRQEYLEMQFTGEAISINRKAQKTGIFSANGSKLYCPACIVTSFYFLSILEKRRRNILSFFALFFKIIIGFFMIFVHISRTSCIIVASFRDQIFSRNWHA